MICQRVGLVLAVAGGVMAASAIAWACVPGAQLRAEPEFGAVGQPATVHGEGFPALPVELRWGTSTGPAVATAQGPAFAQEFVVPNVPDGVYTIIAVPQRAPAEAESSPPYSPMSRVAFEVTGTGARGNWGGGDWEQGRSDDQPAGQPEDQPHDEPAHAPVPDAQTPNVPGPDAGGGQVDEEGQPVRETVHTPAQPAEAPPAEGGTRSSSTTAAPAHEASLRPEPASSDGRGAASGSGAGPARAGQRQQPRPAVTEDTADADSGGAAHGSGLRERNVAPHSEPAPPGQPWPRMGPDDDAASVAGTIGLGVALFAAALVALFAGFTLLVVWRTRGPARSAAGPIVRHGRTFGCLLLVVALVLSTAAVTSQRGLAEASDRSAALDASTE